MPDVLNTTELATISDDGRYRYSLSRFWAPLLGEVQPQRVCLFVMLNPSTADAEHDDPTIRRCLGYAKSWGCAELHIVNLFGLRATDPAALRRAADPIGPDNDDFLRRKAQYLARACSSESPVVCGWGNHGRIMDRDLAVFALLRSEGLLPQCLKVNTASGQPAHPLYLPRDLEPIAYSARAR